MKDAILSYFLNPFDPELQKDSLYHLVSSSPLDESISTNLLSVKENGIKLKKEFEERLSGNSEKEFFSPILRGQSYNGAQTCSL